jgi:pyruvate kinase
VRQLRFAVTTNVLMRNTKIIATFGPACAREETLLSLVEAGMDLMRLNFAHVAHDELGAAMRCLRGISSRIGRPIPIVQDLQGARLRVGDLEAIHEVSEGERVRFAPEAVAGPRDIPVSHETFATLVDPGHRILLDDGLIEIIVERVENSIVHGVVRIGGRLRPRRGVILPDKPPRLGLSTKDFDDLRFGILNGVDMVVRPLVHSAEDVHQLRTLVKGLDASIPILAKLESSDSIRNVSEIVLAADGLVFPRQDLAITIGNVAMQVAQRRAAEVAAAAGKPIMMAYAALESMIEYPRPTLLETAAIFQAVSDGYSGVILSGETAVGRFPVEAVREAATIVEEAEHLLGARAGFFSCFISYSSHDEEFARRLRVDLMANGVQCWFAPEDLKIGDPIRERIDRSIRSYDRLLLILSSHSVASHWVEAEVETALERESTNGPVLFPVRLDDEVMKTETPWAAHIRRTRHIGDFCRWKNYDEYWRGLNRLLRDLHDA